MSARTFPLKVLNKMTEEDAKALFQELRWAETGGKPVCSHCGHTEAWTLTGDVKRFKCKARGCRRLFSVTSGTIFASHHMSFKDMLTGLRAFTLNAKGYSAIAFSKEVGCDYKTAFVFQHKVREAMMHAAKDIRLDGEIEMHGCWFGGYVKPENVKINRVDRRLTANRTGKRRVVVGLRERGEGGRSIVNLFNQEGEALSWIRERCHRGAMLFADEAPAWDDIHASHKAGRVNHSEQYALGKVNEINTNQMESLFSRMRRFEVGTHHHIAGPYLLRYANDTAWRENHRRLDDMGRVRLALRSALTTPISRTFCGYWQQRGPRQMQPVGHNFYANFV